MFFGRWEPDFKKIVECTWLEQTVDNYLFCSWKCQSNENVTIFHNGFVFYNER